MLDWDGEDQLFSWDYFNCSVLGKQITETYEGDVIIERVLYYLGFCVDTFMRFTKSWKILCEEVIVGTGHGYNRLYSSTYR